MEKSIVENTFRNLWPAELFLATADQLRAAGLGPRIVAEGVRLGLLLRLRRGVYIPRHRWAGTPPWQQAKIRLAAHIAASQRTVTYTYFSAARLHGLHVWDCAPDIHVNAGYQSSPGKSANDVKVHCLPIAGCEIVRKHVPGFGSVCMSSQARTVLDCAMEASFAQAVVIGDSALHKGMALEDLEAALVAMRGRKGIARARKVVRALDALSESAGETRTRLIIAELPIPRPELQAPLTVNGQQYRPDFAWRGIKLIVEFDGNGKYFDYQPTAEALIRERERESALMEQGWIFVRLKWRHLAAPDQVKTRILDAYDKASAAQAA
jgi:very-short-patch-repair endonuclease